MRIALTLWLPAALTFTACSKADASGNDQAAQAADGADPTHHLQMHSASQGREAHGLGPCLQVLEKGTGMVKPRPTNSVTVHYTGWT